ncbi:A24 family peptidase [Streptosporangium sp. NPDC051023]|uniref:prepilin peptidase n=1 Tax=Streptosporangium sp. NPDC051023 TaxID=3155410 RepID=UPI00345096B4
MSLLPVVAAFAGSPLGFWTRTLVVRHSVAEREPLRYACPRCETPLPRIALRRRPEETGAPEGTGTPPEIVSGGRSERDGASGRQDGGFAGAGARLGAGTARWGRLAPFASLAAGRCPGCRRRIGPPPLTVEFVTAALLTALALRAPSPVWPGAVRVTPRPEVASAGELLAYGWLAVVAVGLVFVDVAVHRLPDRLTLAACLGTAAPLTVTALLEGRPGDLLRALFCGLALAAFYLLLFVINPSGMGLGDVKLAVSLGIALGWLGWNALVTGAFLGFLAGGLYGGALLVARRARRGSEIPFGPFMIAGAFAVILTGMGG